VRRILIASSSAVAPVFVPPTRRGGLAIRVRMKDRLDLCLQPPPSGFMGGSPEDALDTACGLYLADPTAWT
jgi:hypothetical protein